MPIEIRELHIKAIVENASEGESAQKEGANNENAEERILRACIERVMDLIEEAKER